MTAASSSSSWRRVVDAALSDWPIDYGLLEEDVPPIGEADILKRMGLPYKAVQQPTPAETAAALMKRDAQQVAAATGRFMQLAAIPSAESARSVKRQRRAVRMQTAGKQWYNLPRQESDEAQSQALEMLQMRRSLDTKTFYRRNDHDKPARYYQVGTFVDRPVDYYSGGRVTRRQRRADTVDELLASEDFMRQLRQRYRRIQQAKIAAGVCRANKLKRLARRTGAGSKSGGRRNQSAS